MSANLFDLSASPVQSGLCFPASLTEKYRPVDIADFIGLDKVKRVLAKFASNPRELAFLFLGPSGVGKTTMGLALARALSAEVHHIPSQECNLESIERVRRTCQYVPRAGCRMHLVLIDEADRMSDAAQVSLLSKLDSTNFPPNTVFVFTANATDRLEARFLSRLLTLEFSSYGLAKDATALLETIWEAETEPGCEKPNFARLVKDSNNNVRESLMRLETEILAS
jgi:replication-associated recombination protein RarA